ncbi:MAG: hypothetical protein QF898_08320 [SAR202 cluster bacterium]|jgi:hypothetical protein|nr:hypothetical protein [SAR202 cluster bacterium]MDP6513617.1 hypothetical protein [SAR202 cluster bacterium]MDP6716255.1 hypothetical protein [SAR202 cluster bacterium]
MHTQDSRIAVLAIPIGVIIASAVIVSGAWLIAGDGLPSGAMIVVSMVGGVGTMWGVFNLSFRNSGGAGLERFYTLGFRPRSATSINIVAADGVCPRGFKINDTIEVGADGALSNSMCRVAVEALRPSILSRPDTPGFNAMPQCQCPIANTQLTFAPDTPAPVRNH